MRITRIETEGLKAYDREVEIGALSLLVGPTGAGKTTILDAVQILLHGEHASGEKRIVRPLDILTEFGRNGEIKIDGDTANPEIKIQRRLAFKGEGEKTKVDHALWTSLGPGKIKKQQERLDAKIGSGGLHFSIKQYVRATEREKREILLSLMASACPMNLEDIQRRVGELPEGANSEAVEPLVWLDEIRESIAEILKTKNARLREVDASARENSAATAIGSPEIVRQREAELADLRAEREDIAKQRGTIEQADRERAHLTSEIESLEKEIAEDTKRSGALLDGALVVAIKEKDRATGALVNRGDERREITAKIDKLKAEAGDYREKRAAAVARKAAAKERLDQIRGGRCPLCENDHISESLVSDLQVALDAADLEIAQSATALERNGADLDSLLNDEASAQAAVDIAQRDLDAAKDRIRDLHSKTEELRALRKTGIPAKQDRLASMRQRLADLATDATPAELDIRQDAVDLKITEATAAHKEATAALETEKAKARAAIESTRLNAEVDTLNTCKSEIDKIRIEAVGKMIDPLTVAMQPFLGPLGTFTVRLEDEKGRACFRPGIERDGVFRELTRLSGGESAAVLPAFSMALATFGDPSFYQPVLIDDIQLLDSGLREEYLRLLADLVITGEVSQAFVTWNVRADELPAWIADVSEITIIDLWGPQAVAAEERVGA